MQILPELNEGGVERGVVELTREFNDYGITSYVISNGGSLTNELEKNGVKHIKFDVYSKNLLTFFIRSFKLKKILKDINPDIVHIRSRLPAWLLRFAKSGLKFKVVSSVHGLNSPNFYSKIMTDADRIICVSNAVKEHIIKHFNAPLDKIRVIFRGVDLSSFDASKLASKDELRDEFGLKKDEFIVSCVGRITQGKNIKTLLKSTELLKKQFKNIRVLIVGGVHHKRKKHFEELKKLCEVLDISDVVNFVGSIKDIAKIYKLSDVVVSPSSKPESFGRSVAEALAMNIPVVASNHGGVKDIVKDSINGYFFEPFDEVELAQKIASAKGLKFDGFSYISSKFTLKNMTDETIKVYKEVV